MSGDTHEPSFAVFVAIDWADRKHVFALQDAAGSGRERGEIQHTPEAVESWVASLLLRFGSRPIAVCLEQSRGALLTMLLRYESLVFYPANPATLARRRQGFYPSGAKDDPPDAELLLDLLTLHRERLRRLEPDTVELRMLQFLVEDRRKLVDEKRRQKNRLRDRLKLSFPQVLEWFDEIDSREVEESLRRWPTLEKLQRARSATLGRFFERHHPRSHQRNGERVAAIRQGHGAMPDAAVRAAARAMVATLLRLLGTLAEGIAAVEKQIEQITAAEEDFALFDSFPGAGPALAPRLLVAFGTWRDRFDGATQVQAFSADSPEAAAAACEDHTQLNHGGQVQFFQTIEVG